MASSNVTAWKPAAPDPSRQPETSKLKHLIESQAGSVQHWRISSRPSDSIGRSRLHSCLDSPHAKSQSVRWGLCIRLLRLAMTSAAH